MKPHQFNLRDELFWFGKPRLLLRLIQLISFLVSNISNSHFTFLLLFTIHLFWFLCPLLFSRRTHLKCQHSYGLWWETDITFFSALLYLNDAIIIVLIVQWEINNPSCFMNNRTLVAVRLTFGYKFVFANVIYFQPNTAESQFRKKSNIYFFAYFIAIGSSPKFGAAS
jgi:hypothetical protein